MWKFQELPVWVIKEKSLVLTGLISNLLSSYDWIININIINTIVWLAYISCYFKGFSNQSAVQDKWVGQYCSLFLSLSFWFVWLFLGINWFMELVKYTFKYEDLFQSIIK